MKPRLCPARYVLLTCTVACLLSACSVVGPRAISSGRLAYNEAISETDNQQMLMVLLHNRYGERGHLLTVASVTANVSVTTSAGIEAGFGNSSDYRGNLVPFTGGFVYEENPTISYIPVAGERYLSELTRPLSMTLLTQMSRSVTDPSDVLLSLVSGINGIYNPDFYFDDEDQDPRFEKVVNLIAELTRAHRLNWVEASTRPVSYSIVIDQSRADHARQTRELLTLLGLSPEKYTSPRIVIPVSLALDSAQIGGIGFTTRSVWDMVEILAGSIEVPAIDMQNGVVERAPPPGYVGSKLRINYSESQPEHAYVAVEFRDGWFYIDERDQVTKGYFKLLGGLWSLTMATASQHNPAAPVLTVPVSR